MRKHTLIAVLLAGVLTLGGCAGAPESAAPEATSSAPASTEASIASSTTSYADAQVSYLGPEGTYTEEAVQQFFGGEGTYVPSETVPDAVKALVGGDTNYAVVPQENTIGGPVTDYVDAVLDEETLSVVGEVELTINQNLLVLPQTKLEDIKTVYSHKQGIAQGKAWLEQNLPNAEVIEVSSTAEGARKVAEEGDATHAAIASAGCADVYGLEILAQSIQQNDSNKTRFYVLSREEPQQAASDRIAFVAAGPASALPDLMAAMAKQGLTVVAVHDRPQKTELGQYRYLVECSGAKDGAYDEVSKTEGFEFRLLGNFPVR